MAEEEKTKAEQNAALSNLSTEGKSDASTSGNPVVKAQDQAALTAAISKLSTQEQQQHGGGSSSKGAGAESGDKTKKIKLSDDDVSFFTTQLELTKKKAEELLRKHDGDRSKALRDYILPSSIVR